MVPCCRPAKILRACSSFAGCRGPQWRGAGRDGLGDVAGSVDGILIGEDDDGDAILGKNHVFSGKAGNFAAVGKRAVAGIVAHVDAEAVPRAGAVLQQDIRFHFPIGGGREQFLLHEGDVPLGEIFGGHRQFAGGEEPALAFLGSGARGPRP